MYLGISVENFVTIGVMLLIWMLAIHLIGQLGLYTFPSWMPGSGS